MKHITHLSDLPDRPCLDSGRYWPTTDIWAGVEWTLTPRSKQIFTDKSQHNWPENSDNPEPEHMLGRLDLTPGPSVLLIGCSYLAGDYLPQANRLLAILRRENPGFRFSSLATSGAGLVTNLAHASKFLPSDYQPDIVVLAPTQTHRQFIAESPQPFNKSPYGLWQNYFWIDAQSAKRASMIREELIHRDCLRLEYLCKVMFPTSTVFIILFDSEGTEEISLLKPRERARIEEYLLSLNNVRGLMNRDEMRSFYTSLGPFDERHPNQRQIVALAGRIGCELPAVEGEWKSSSFSSRS